MPLMRIHIPNSVFLGNINHFLNGFDPSEPDKLEITSHPKWFWVHPVVLCMIAAIGKPVKPENIRYEVLARTKHNLSARGWLIFSESRPVMKFRNKEMPGPSVHLIK